MKKILKNELIKIFEAPKPEQKRMFLRQMNVRPVNMADMIYTQISYISKLEWLLSALVCGVTVWMSWYLKTAAFGVVLALMPFLAVACVSESVRSVIYGMDELEMTTRFSLKSIILARMAIVGTENLTLALLLAWFTQGGLFWTVYLLAPYLITAYGSLFIVRKVTSRDGIYICMIFSVIVGLGSSLGSKMYIWIYQEQFQVLWMAFVIMLAFMSFREGRQLLKVTEYC